MVKQCVIIIAAVCLLFLLACQNDLPSPTAADHGSIAKGLQKRGGGKGGNEDQKSDPFGDCPNIYYESSKVLKNGVKVTWTSSFGGFNYERGSDYGVTVTWSVDAGTAEFVSFTAKRKTWTPKGVNGSSSFDPGTGNLTVSMLPMHRAVEQDWQGYIGNGHFKLELKVTNGNGTVWAKLGVNVHLEDPDDGYSWRCP